MAAMWQTVKFEVIAYPFVIVLDRVVDRALSFFPRVEGRIVRLTDFGGVDSGRRTTTVVREGG